MLTECLFKVIYLFIWLHQVFIAALGIFLTSWASFVAVYGLSSHGLQAQ